jgi:hypothetical protein
LATSVLVFTSQPSAGFKLQSAAAPRHGPSRHAPLWQRASALANEQTLPQAPQFEGSLCVLTSHPVDVMWSQSAKGELQFTILHALDVQSGFALSRLHANPQVPQFAVLAVRFTSQSEGLPSQLAKFWSHAPKPHVPRTQAGLPFATCGHARSQELQ